MSHLQLGSIVGTTGLGVIVDFVGGVSVTDFAVAVIAAADDPRLIGPILALQVNGPIIGSSDTITVTSILNPHDVGKISAAMHASVQSLGPQAYADFLEGCRTPPRFA